MKRAERERGGGGGGGKGAGTTKRGRPGDKFLHFCLCQHFSVAASPMKRVKLTAKPVSKNWSMEKQGRSGR